MELFNAFAVSLQAVWNDSGFAAFTAGNGIMILVGLVLLYLAIVKEFEPLLLGPIAFGCILANFPRTGFLTDPGLMQAIHYGIANEIFPPLIFSVTCGISRDALKCESTRFVSLLKTVSSLSGSTVQSPSIISL